MSTRGPAVYGEIDYLDTFRVISVNRPGYFGLPLHVVEDIDGHADISYSVLRAVSRNLLKTVSSSMHYVDAGGHFVWWGDERLLRLRDLPISPEKNGLTTLQRGINL